MRNLLRHPIRTLLAGTAALSILAAALASGPAAGATATQRAASPAPGTEHTIRFEGPAPNSSVTMGRSWKRITQAPTANKYLDTVCSQHDDRGSLLCVSTGPGVPTTVWFDNRSGIDFPINLGVIGNNFDNAIWGGQVYSRNGTIEGAQWTGFANDCFWGLVWFPDGNWGAQTHAPACV